MVMAYRNFSSRLSFLYLIAFITIFSFSGVFISKRLEREAIEHLTQTLEVQTRLTADVLGHQNLKENEALLSRVNHLAKTLNARVTLINPEGRVMADSEVPWQNLTQLENHAERAEVQKALRGGRGAVVRFSNTLNTKMLYVALPVTDTKGLLHYVLRLALPLYRVDNELSVIRWTIAAISLMGIGFLLLVIFLLGRHLRVRIRNIVAMAEGFQKLDDQAAVPEIGEDDEFDHLANAINKLAVSLKNRYADIDTEKNKLSVVLENMTEGVIAVDRRRNVLMLNHSAASIFQIKDPQGAMGRGLLELTLNSLIDDQVRECIQQKTMVSKDIELSRPEPKTIKMNVIGLPQAQGAIHAIIVAHDITQIRKLENMRREFVANVSHELRTPLTSINGFIETLLAGAVNDPEKRDQFLKIIQDDATRLSRLINDLLEISKLESRETRLKTRLIHAADSVEQVLQMLQRQIEARKIKVENELQHSSLTLIADEDKFKQVLINLLDNAIKFNRPEGTIRISAKSGPESEIMLIIEDTGIGIPKDKVERIFERFFRVDKGRSRQLGGTGLGLSIVKHIMEAHGGRVECESKVNAGTRFLLYFPSVQPAKESTLPSV